MYINHKPFLIIISSPSGAGKSTLCRMVIQNDPLIKLSISTTTRKKRLQEVNNIDYNFISKEEFINYEKNNEFLESALVFENYYGTPSQPVYNNLKKGYETLFDIDWQGARQIRNKFDSEDIVSIFILPPSLVELNRRLMARGQDSDDIVAKRMAKAIDEISHFDEYDFIIINDELNNSYQKIRSIIEAKRVSRYNKEDILRNLHISNF
jgi:guanylate kinase